jgi:hypothetical protein
MKQLKLAKKIKGFALSSELIFLSTIVTAGLSVGMVSVRDSVVSEMVDVGKAVGTLNQSYTYAGVINAAKTTQVSGSGYKDVVDVLAGDTGTFTFTAADTTEVSTSAGGTAGVDGAAAAPTL